jgi:hypothetical protein
MRRILIATFLVGAAMSVGPLVSAASACPMCKEANDVDDRRPQAYMYSILFMLAMPATIFTGFGVSFYRLSKKQQAMNNEVGLDLTQDSPDCVGDSPDDSNS